MLWSFTALVSLGLAAARAAVAYARERCPRRKIAALDAPVLIVGGELDQRTLPEETRQLFAAALEPKQLWIVAGAGHYDLHDHAPQEYERRVLRFLVEQLGE